MDSKIKYLLSALLLSIIILSTLYFAHLPPFEREVVEIDILTEQYSFDPDKITVDYGVRVRLFITSQDFPHSFQLTEFGIINVQTPPGVVTEIEFVADQRGIFTYYSTVFCGPGFANHNGQLTVI